MAKGFSFGVKKKAIKKQVKKVALTEEQISEDNPELQALVEDTAADKNKARLRRENALSKKKQGDFNQTHFYSCLIWQSYEQKMEFLSNFPDVLCIDDVYIDGETFAEAIGKKVTPNELPPIESPLNKKLVDLSKIPR